MAQRNSRSPALVSRSPMSSSRTFLPPSHYAAASGMSYPPRSPKTPAIRDRKPSSNFSYTVFAKDDDSEARHDNLKIMMPVSQPEPESSSSISSFEYKPIGDPRFTVTPEPKSHPSKQNLREKRQSTMAGLPELEAQLLPSLRDTIDRMTRPPSRNLSSSSSRHEGTPLSEEIPPVPRNSEALSSRISNHSLSISSPQPARPSASSSIAHQKELPISEVTSYKIALKSAMKSSTTKVFSPTPDLPSAPVDSGPSSLRSVKSLLGRGTPTTSKSNSPLSSGSFRKSLLKGIKSPDTFLGRNKPRIDLGISSATVRSAPVSPSTTPRDPQTSFGNQVFEPKTYTSNIPRPKNKIAPVPAIVDESDIEFRWEQDRRDGRKLTVANIEAFTSSSSSEGEANYVTAEANTSAGRFLPRPSAYPSSEFRQNAVGLGLNIQMNADSHNYTDRSNSWRPRHSDPRNAQEASTRYSLISSTSAESLYSERVTSYKDNYHDAGSPEETYQEADHRRRQEDLVNIVADIRLPRPSRGMRCSMASDYCGEEGIAFSDSGDISDIPPNTPNNDDKDSTDDNYGRNFNWSRSPKGRPRSSSCMPTFLISQVENDEFVPDEYSPNSPELRRPHSACDWTPPAQTPRLSSSNRMIRSQSAKSSPRSPVQSKIASSPRRSPKNPSWNASRAEHSTSTARSSSEWSDKKFDAGRKFKTNNLNVALPSHHTVAALERQAFGIPPSESDDILRGSDRQYRLSHAESDLSSVGSSYWQENLDELSTGAETLFRKLSGGSAKQMQRRSHQVQELHNIRMSITSQTSTVSSNYEDYFKEDEPGAAGEGLRQEYDTAKDRSYGQEHSDTRPFGEITTPSPPWPSLDAGDRVELIRRLFGTEEVFVSRLNVCVEMFVLPLRMENSKVWIAGVPPGVARLLDWFEDILNLHVQVYQSLQFCQERRQPMSSIISAFLSYVPKLEIYQPYLVRLADVTEEIVALMQDDESDFGEFISLQERSAGSGWTLEKFLLEPVNRLAEYQDIISKIVDLTPRQDPDFLLTFSLQRATDIVIRAMTEVKLREQDYDRLKRLRDRIKGWPSGFNLATRERRLIYQGTLNLCVLNPVPLSTSPIPAAAKFLSRSRKLTDIISDWDAGRERSDSVKSAMSSSTGGSFRSYGTSSSSASSNVPVTPSLATRLPMSRLPVLKAARPDHSFSDDHNLHSRFKSPLTSSPNRGQVSLQVQVFVFSDIFILATPIANMREQEWNLLDDIGISKAISCTEVSDTKQEDFSFDVEIIPTKPDKQGAVPENTIVAVRFSLPKQTPAAFFDTSRISSREAYDNWMVAFRGCARPTLQSLSIPWLANNADFNSDPASAMRRAVDTLISSGLPMPKSPSGQLPNLEELHLERSPVHEREERGWWSLRFQQTLRELHREAGS